MIRMLSKNASQKCKTTMHNMKVVSKILNRYLFRYVRKLLVRVVRVGSEFDRFEPFLGWSSTDFTFHEKISENEAFLPFLFLVLSRKIKHEIEFYLLLLSLQFYAKIRENEFSLSYSQKFL